MPRVLLTFFSRYPDEWVVQFLQEDCKTSVGRIRVYSSEVPVREIIARAVVSAEESRELEAEFHKGRGSIWLEFTEAQYAKLRG